MITIKNRNSGEQQAYSVSPEEALVSAVMLSSGGGNFLTDRKSRDVYKQKIKKVDGKLVLGLWEVDPATEEIIEND